VLYLDQRASHQESRLVHLAKIAGDSSRSVGLSAEYGARWKVVFAALINRLYWTHTDSVQSYDNKLVLMDGLEEGQEGASGVPIPKKDGGDLGDDDEDFNDLDD
jgi:hypothetical protein